MGGLKSLAKDTMIYGVSSIVGRFLNWLLVPLYTNVFPVAEYGVVTFMYNVVALGLIVLIYGMETGLFRFVNHERWHDPMEVYSTSLISLATTSTLFVVLVLVFLNPITDWMKCAGHPSYVAIMAVCMAADAFSAIPFCFLRYRKRALRFAGLKMLNIGFNIGFNLFFIVLCPVLAQKWGGAISWFYRPEFGVGYIFLSNMLASLITLLMLIPELRGFKWRFNSQLLREMLVYSAPLLVLGIAGMMNQTIGTLLYPSLVSDPDEAMYGLGIYGANFKLAVLLLVFLQGFRFAYEPFVFSRARESGDSKNDAYSEAMKYFVVFALLIYLGVMFYLDVIKYFINPRYFAGLIIVPIVMLGELFYGIFYNLSVWYKLSDKTVWGMWFSLLGLAVTLGGNFLLVPRISYVGCAVASLACYTVMMVASYLVGQRKYPINYHVGRLGLYFALAGVLYLAGYTLLPLLELGVWVNGAVRMVLLVLFVAVFVRVEGLNVKELLQPVLHFLHRGK